MDPFKYVDLNEMSETGDTPPTRVDRVDQRTMSLSLPLILPGKPGVCQETTTNAGHHYIRTKSECINDGVHIITAIVQTKPLKTDVLPGPVGSSLSSAEIQSCSFCKKNGERPEMYLSHPLHYITDEGKRVRCPILRSVKCPICQATGDFAHTLSHCPFSTNRVSVALMLKSTARQGNGSYRKGARPIFRF